MIFSKISQHLLNSDSANMSLSCFIIYSVLLQIVQLTAVFENTQDLLQDKMLCLEMLWFLATYILNFNK